MFTSRLIPIALCVLVGLTSPASALPTDARILGTWLEPVFDATVLVTYRADHTFVASGYFLGEKTPTSLGTGRWGVVGDRLITHFKGKEVRRRIVSISDTELELEESPGKIFTYKRTD